MSELNECSKEPSAPDANRREFLRHSAAAVTASSLLARTARAHAKSTAHVPVTDVDSIPPHKPVVLPGIHAYAEKSIVAGQTLLIRSSSDYPYLLSIRRLGNVDEPETDQVLHEFPETNPGRQPVHPGSYIHVARGLDGDGTWDALTVECWVRPWRVNRWQGIVTQHDQPDSCGLGLFLDSRARISFYLASAGPFQSEALHHGPPLRQRTWYHVAASWNGSEKSLWLDGNQVGRWKFEGALTLPIKVPLRLGASGERGQASHFLDGDLSAPAIYRRALDPTELRSRFRSRALGPPKRQGLVGWWPLNEESGSAVADASGRQRHGRLINHATWMVGGPSFDGAKVRRYVQYDPQKDKTRGHGLRLAADDLYNCRWSVTHRFQVPQAARPGIYEARFDFRREGRPAHYRVTFIVRRSVSRPRPRMLVLCSTNTWLAYSATPFAVNAPAMTFWDTVGLKNSAERAPAYCFYREHHAGQPTYQVGVNMPWPVAGHDVLFSRREIGYSHLMRGERFLHVWLEQGERASGP